MAIQVLLLGLSLINDLANLLGVGCALRVVGNQLDFIKTTPVQAQLDGANDLFLLKEGL